MRSSKLVLIKLMGVELLCDTEVSTRIVVFKTKEYSVALFVAQVQPT